MVISTVEYWSYRKTSIRRVRIFLESFGVILQFMMEIYSQKCKVFLGLVSDNTSYSEQPYYEEIFSLAIFYNYSEF